MAGIYKNGELDPRYVPNPRNNAKMPNLDWLIQAGIDPKTLLPIKLADPSKLRTDMKTNLRIQDEQDAIGTFEWFNLPEGLSGEELERLLYYKGQLAFFYNKGTGSFFFMPYTLDGSLDFYGRYNTIHPVPMFWGNETKEEKAIKEAQKKYLSTLKLNVIKDIKLDFITPEFIESSCVILHDYTPQANPNKIIPRVDLQEGIIGLEADIPCYLRTALKNSTGVVGMRVNDQSASSNVLAANAAMDRAAIEGDRLIPVIAQIEFQDLAGGDVLKAEEYLESLQAIDNLRLGFHGIENGGLFQKKSHMLQDEQNMNMGKANSVLQDRLSNRQHFCDIVNSYTGLGIWCEPKENAIGADMDMDGTSVEDNPDNVSYANNDGGEENVQS